MRGSRHPLLINQFGTERRMCLALGVDRLDDVAAKLADVLELTPPQGIADKLRALGKLKSLADVVAEDRLARRRARRSCSTRPISTGCRS